MILFNPLPAAVTDEAGLPIVGARLFFFLTETEALANVYQDAEGVDEHANPVVADSSGRFAAIFVPAGIYDVVLTDQDEDTGSPIWRADAYEVSDAISDLIGIEGHKLGYLDADKTDSGDNVFLGSNTFSGLVEFAEAINLPAGSTIDGSQISTAGSQTVVNSNYTLVLSDAGNQLFHTSASTHTWTIPPNTSVAFVHGTRIELANSSAGGAITVAQGAGVTLRWIPPGTTGARTLAANGAVVLTKMATDEWWITGANLT